MYTRIFFEKLIVWNLLNFEVISSLFNTENNQTVIILIYCMLSKVIVQENRATATDAFL